MSTTARNLIVIKKPRATKLPDVAISFPPLQNLHLELMEIKDKLKPGLPLIPRSHPKIRAKGEPSLADKTRENFQRVKREAVSEPETIQDSLKDDVLEVSAVSDSEVRSRKIEKPDKRAKSVPEKRSREAIDSDLDSILNDLGEDDLTSGAEQSEPQMSEDDVDAGAISDEEPSNNVNEEEDEASEDEDDIYAGLTPEEREIKEKEEYIWRFRILKKQYGRSATIPIPEWNEHSDLHMMKTSYDRTIKELYLDDSVESYRTYLLAGWIVIEYISTTVVGIDLRGFTMQQTRMMHKYDRMLIELGEKSYTQWGQSLPVEVRLLGMVLFQAVIFYLGKVITEKFGGSMAELFYGYTGQPPAPEPSTPVPQSNETESAPKGKRMRGPRIRAEDIRKRAGVQKSSGPSEDLAEDDFD